MKDFEIQAKKDFGIQVKKDFEIQVKKDAKIQGKTGFEIQAKNDAETKVVWGAQVLSIKTTLKQYNPSSNKQTNYLTVKQILEKITV